MRVGDSLDGIARKLGVGFAELLAANSLTESSVIHPGDTLTVPAGARNIPATPPAAPTTPDKIVAVRRVL